MGKSILIEYACVRKEIKDIRRRIKELDKGIKDIGIVSDSVKGTRHDGTIGSIRISGYPTPLFYKKKAAIDKLQATLCEMELELIELTCKAEEYIKTIPKSELRLMYRLYFIDDLTYAKTAEKMNKVFPNRTIAYTDENVKKRIQRYLGNVPLCTEEK